jgi:hypothetical protein
MKFRMQLPVVAAAAALLAVVSAAASPENAFALAAEKAAGELAAEGRDGWRFLVKELEHLAAGSPGEGSEPVEAIADFAGQLAKLGVRLIVVPVPPKAGVEAERLGAKVPAENPDAPTLRALQAKGVEVIDLWPDFVAADRAEPVYLERDSHWNARAIAIAAEKIAAAIEGGVTPGAPFDEHSETVEIQGDLGGAPEQTTLRFVHPPGSRERLEPSRESPVLVFGDSHVLVFHDGGDMHAASAGLPEQVARALRAPVDVLAVRGSGATSARISLARRARSNPGWLEGKAVVVWCLGAREFTQAAAWKKIPLLPTE